MKIILSKITVSGLLSSLSFFFVFFVLLLYLIGSIWDISSLNNIFERASDRGLIWFTVLFVLLCNLDYLREIIKSAVREKMDSLVVSDVREEVKRSIENDPDMLRKLKDAEEKREKQSFINQSINPK